MYHKIDLTLTTIDSLEVPGLDLPVVRVSAIITYFVTKNRLAWGNQTPNYYDSKSCMFNSLSAAKSKVESLRTEKGQSYRIDQTATLHFEGQHKDLLAVDLSPGYLLKDNTCITPGQITFRDAIRYLIKMDVNTSFSNTMNLIVKFGDKKACDFEPLVSNKLFFWYSRSAGVRYLLNWYSVEITKDVKRTLNLANCFNN